MTRNWYSIRAAAKPRTAEIWLYDEIGQYGITAADFARDFRALGRLDSITLRINSPGGEVFDGIAIFNILKSSPAHLTVVVDGVAASMASAIAMAGDRVLMPENTHMMIHDPRGLVMGTATDMRDLAEVLDKVATSLISAYTDKTKLSTARITEMMKAETWMTAHEARGFGFADEVVAPVRIAARVDLSAFKHPPAAAIAQAPAASAGSWTPPAPVEPSHTLLVDDMRGRAQSMDSMRRQLARQGLTPVRSSRVDVLGSRDASLDRDLRRAGLIR